MRKHVLYSLGFILFFSSCLNYKTTNYDRLAPKHKTLAILPFETIYTGKIPANITDEEIRMIEKIEALEFQRSLYAQLMRKLRGKDVSVTIQPITKTNALLETQNMKDTPSIETNKLAEALGVDAVLITRVHKDQYLTELEQVGVTIIGSVLSSLQTGVLLINGLAPSSRVDIECGIYDSEWGEPIWILQEDLDVAWSDEHIEVVDRINGRIARRFPYKE